jgi:hypothetical protein
MNHNFLVTLREGNYPSKTPEYRYGRWDIYLKKKHIE